MQNHVPSPALDAINHAIKHRHIGRAAKMFHEIETYAAHAAAIEGLEILVGEIIVDNCNAAIAPWIGGDAVEHGGVVGSVTARLHDDGALYSQMSVQRCQHLLRRIIRRVSPIGRVGKFRAGAEDMAMGVATARRQLETWFATMGEKAWLDVHGLAL